jgi:hypothetical protein
MVRDARGVLLFEFDGLLFDLATELARILSLPTKVDIWDRLRTVRQGETKENMIP